MRTTTRRRNAFGQGDLALRDINGARHEKLTTDRTGDAQIRIGGCGQAIADERPRVRSRDREADGDIGLGQIDGSGAVDRAVTGAAGQLDDPDLLARAFRGQGDFPNAHAALHVLKLPFLQRCAAAQLRRARGSCDRKIKRHLALQRSTLGRQHRIEDGKLGLTLHIEIERVLAFQRDVARDRQLQGGT